MIIDDISWLTDVSSRDYVIKLLVEGGKHVILIGRASFPQWMSEFMLQYDFLRIGEKDLQFGIDEIAEYMKLKSVILTDEDLVKVLENIHGYPPMVAMYSEHIEAGETIAQRMYSAVIRNLCDHFVGVVSRLHALCYNGDTETDRTGAENTGYYRGKG